MATRKIAAPFADRPVNESAAAEVPAVDTPLAPIPEFAPAPVDVVEPAPIVAPAPVEMTAPVFEPAPMAAPSPVVASAPAVAFAEVAKTMERPLAGLKDMPAKVRALIETRIAETRANYAKAKTAADEAASALEACYATAAHGAVQLNVKGLEALKATASANFDFAKAAMSVRSAADFVTLQGEFARKQIEHLTAQTRAFSELAQKVAAEAAEPIKTQVVKTFKKAS